MANIKLIAAYDGTNYRGWQETKEEPSIEGALKSAFRQILQQEVILNAASRTDAGVHAKELPVNFHTTKNPDPGKLIHGLNACLPEEIAVLSASYVPENFHATIDCKAKEYIYQLCILPFQLPQRRYYSWHYPYPLNLHEMRIAGEMLLGSHDFLSFCNAKKNEKYADTIRTLLSIGIEEPEPGCILIKIKGTSFLYKMARNIVGLLVYVGRGKIPIESVKTILDAKDRTQGGVTAPAHGLSLNKVFYRS